MGRKYCPAVWFSKTLCLKRRWIWNISLDFQRSEVWVVLNIRVYMCVSDFRPCVWPDGIIWLLLHFLRYEHTGNVYFLYFNRLSEKIHSIVIRTNVFHAFLVGLFVLSAALISLLASVWRKPRNKTVTPWQDPEIWSADNSAVVIYDEEVVSPIP